jgi:hypothetical protein
VEKLTTQFSRGILNCHGCKWLDRYKKDGNDYCCMVELSSQKHDVYCKIRYPEKERCELYEAGDFATRYEGKTQFRGQRL